MTYVDYAETAKDHRKQVARCYYESRRDAKNADKNYRRARQYFRNAEFFAHFRPSHSEDGENTAACFEGLAQSTLRLADTYLQGSFNNAERARFYAGLARSYDELAQRVNERLSA